MDVSWNWTPRPGGQVRVPQVGEPKPGAVPVAEPGKVRKRKPAPFQRGHAGSVDTRPSAKDVKVGDRVRFYDGQAGVVYGVEKDPDNPQFILFAVDQGEGGGWMTQLRYHQDARVEIQR